jgi:hypothetical protein
LLIDIVQNKMQVLDKKEKKQLVIELYRQNKTIREIAQQAHISFSDIGKIIRLLDGRDDDVDVNDLKDKSKDTKALHLLSIGKTPLDVAIELDMPASQVYEIQLEFWSLKDLHDLVFLYGEIKYNLASFVELFHTLKCNKMLGGERITKFLRYADHDLPALENKFQKLTGDVIDLEWKKRDLRDTITLWNAQLSDLGQKITQYQNAIENKKQQLMRMEKRKS